MSCGVEASGSVVAPWGRTLCKARVASRCRKQKNYMDGDYGNQEAFADEFNESVGKFGH
jgi:hypothetical protein